MLPAWRVSPTGASAALQGRRHPHPLMQHPQDGESGVGVPSGLGARVVDFMRGADEGAG